MSLSVEKPFGSKQEMKPTQIVKCTQCHGLMITIKGQKTKTCPYCGAHVDLLQVQKIAQASNAFEASTMLRKLKTEEGFNHKQT
jgi:DnaJ-class molecular chaperone